MTIPKKMLYLLMAKSRYKVAYGGRGSGKSYGFADGCIIRALKTKTRILCARQLQNSIKDSVHKLLGDRIAALGLSDYFEITRENIRCKNGSEFIFKGIQNNVQEIKSMEGINICWVEEAEGVTEESWDILIPTIRTEGSEIWVSFNPNMKTDATYQKFVVNPPENCTSIKINYDENPFFPEVLREEMEFCKKLNYPKYEHIWLGVPNAEAGNLFKMDKFKRYKYAPEKFNGLYIVCDTAFSEKKSADNSAFELWGVTGKDKYLLDAYCKKVTFIDLCRDLKSFYQKALLDYGQTTAFSSIYIENKASGISLIQQLRAEGLPIIELMPTVHNAELKKDMVADKYTRFLEIEAEIDSGNVWLPEVAPWMPEFERQHEAFTGGKQEEHDDLCFVAGTLIKTKYGNKPIEQLKVGDEVITPFGLRKVLRVKQNGAKTVIFNKTLRLKGTADHKVLTFADGYTHLSDVLDKKECLQWNLKNLIIWKIKSLLYLTEENIVEWGERESISYLMRAETHKGKTPKGYTLLSGNMSTGEKCQKVMSFIIKTIIHLTTALKIWTVFRLVSTLSYIKQTVLNGIIAKPEKNILMKFGNSQKSGIKALRVENGIKSTLAKLLKIRKKQGFVQTAENLSLITLTRQEKQMCRTVDGAQSATTKTGKDYIVNSKEEILPVWNLTIDGGVYFANDVLVSNCDCTIYSLKVSRKYGQTDWNLYKQAFFR